jgi:hypothetical protein
VLVTTYAFQFFTIFIIIFFLYQFFSDALQASQGDLVSGMFCWAHSLFPTLCAKSSGNPLARDLVLQLLERYYLV